MLLSRAAILVMESQKGFTGEDDIRELRQPQRRRQQECHKFVHLTMKNDTFARFARAFFIFREFADVRVLSAT